MMNSQVNFVTEAYNQNSGIEYLTERHLEKQARCSKWFIAHNCDIHNLWIFKKMYTKEKREMLEEGI